MLLPSTVYELSRLESRLSLENFVTSKVKVTELTMTRTGIGILEKEVPCSIDICAGMDPGICQL